MPEDFKQNLKLCYKLQWIKEDNTSIQFRIYLDSYF